MLGIIISTNCYDNSNRMNVEDDFNCYNLDFVNNEEINQFNLNQKQNKINLKKFPNQDSKNNNFSNKNLNDFKNEYVKYPKNEKNRKKSTSNSNDCAFAKFNDKVNQKNCSGKNFHDINNQNRTFGEKKKFSEVKSDIMSIKFK